MQEWDYVNHKPTRWSGPACLAVILMCVAFWAAVIGGGLWLADHNPITTNQEQAP